MAPSMLCQRHAMPSIWSYSASPAFQIAWNTPAFSHSRNRLWTALALPNRSLGKAFHWQPVRSTYTTASNTCRAGLGGRPAPGLRTYSLSTGRSRTGINDSTRFQKSSVTTHESTRFLVAIVLPYAASTTAQDRSLLFTDKFPICSPNCGSEPCARLTWRLSARSVFAARRKTMTRLALSQPESFKVSSTARQP